jgi:MYND finger
VLCGRWESYPREFAKCRRCRKAKYCGKECQSTAWSEGHRFWCSAKDGDEEATEQMVGDQPSGPGSAGDGGDAAATGVGTMTAAMRAERRAERERERARQPAMLTAVAETQTQTQGGRGAANAFRNALNNARAAVGVNPNVLFGGQAPGSGPIGTVSTMTTTTATSSTTTATTSTTTATTTGTTQTRGQFAVGASRVTQGGRHHHPVFDPYLAAHPASFMDQGGRRRAETVPGVTSIVSMDVLATQQARFRGVYGAPLYVEGSTGVSDRTDAGPSRNDRREDDGMRTGGSEHDMVLG